MRIILGAPVMAGNDKIGNVHSVAYNPETLQLTHIIVKRGGLFKSDASIPFRAIQDAHADDSGGTVMVGGDNGSVFGLRDFNRDRNTGSASDSGGIVGNIATPQAPGNSFGIGVPASLQIPGTAQPTSTNQSVNTAGLNAEATSYAYAEGGPGDATRSTFGLGTGSSADTDSAPEAFEGSGSNAADQSRIPDVEDATTGSDEVPLGVFYLMDGAKVRDIGHDAVGTLEAVVFNDSAAPTIDSVIIKNGSDTLVVPGAWLGSITEDDKNISLSRSREELQQGGQGQFAQAPETARNTGIVATDHDLDNGVQRTGKDTSRMQDQHQDRSADVPGTDESVPLSQEASTDHDYDTRETGGISGGLGRAQVGGTYQEAANPNTATVTDEAVITPGATTPAFGQTHDSALAAAGNDIESTGSTLRQDISTTGATFTQGARDTAQNVTTSGTHELEGNEVFNADDVLDTRRTQTNTGA